MDIEQHTFYLEIESGVRHFVFLLRNAGINTECSCHHEGYIQCQTLDPTTEIRIIKTVMIEEGIEDFEIEIHTSLYWSHIMIRSPAFKENADPSAGKQFHAPASLSG